MAWPLQQLRAVSRLQIIAPPNAPFAEEQRDPFPALVVVLNLASRSDRLFHSIDELARQRMSCFLRFDAIQPTVAAARARSRDVIDYDDFVSDVDAIRAADKTGWWSAFVRLNTRDLYAAHVGVKVDVDF